MKNPFAQKPLIMIKAACDTEQPRETEFGRWWTRRMQERRAEGHDAYEAATLVQRERQAPDWKGPRP